jgi:outer membrane protein TolC
MFRKGWFRAASIAALLVVSGAARAEGVAPSEDALARGVDRAAIIRAVIARNPGLKAQAERVKAMRTMSTAEGRLPDPEVMFQVWQVPFARPYAFGDSQMIMAGVTQSFPAPGALGARSEARGYAANAEEAMLADRTRDLVRDVQHAYTDLTEATARHAKHVDHRRVAMQILATAQARQAAGGTLDDVAQAQLELARLDADIATEAASIVRARARINALLGRAFDAPIGVPDAGEPQTIALTPDALVDLAKRTRPDLRAADARAAAERAAHDAARREAAWPMFSVGAYYFAPTTNMPVHGYGVSGSMSLPWLWGGSGQRRDAQAAMVGASKHDVEDVLLRIAVDVGTASANARAAAERLRALRDGALPAAKRALDVTFAAYAANRGDLLGLLRAQRAVVDTEMDIVMARATLDHALADLDWAVGTIVPRTALGPAQGQGGAQ